MPLMTTPSMTCRELVRLITDYLEGGLSRGDRRRFERHLRGCDGCTTYVEQMRETVRIVGSLRKQDLPPPVMDAVVDAYRERQAG